MNICPAKLPDGWAKYSVTLRHDTGKVTLHLASHSLAGALRTALAAEGAPESSVTSIRITRRNRKTP